MNTDNISPALASLMAETIIAAHGGNLYPPVGRMSHPVTDESGRLVTKVVLSVNWCPGNIYSKTGYWLRFAGAWAPLDDEESLKAVLDKVLEVFPYPDRIVPTEDEVRRRLDIRRRNLSFIVQHGDLSERDFEMIDGHMKALSNARSFPGGAPVPLPGDIVEGAYYGGKHPFGSGCIETPYSWQDQDAVSVCAKPYVPWVCTRQTDPGYYINSSGGPFFSFHREDLEYLGEDERLLCDWSHTGPCANGAVHFPVRVNRWRVKENVDY